MSMASMLALAFYGVVFAACLAAAREAGRDGGQRGDVRHWAGVAAIFVWLAAMRLFNAEDRLRAVLRSMTKAAGDYGSRAQFQFPIALAFGVLILILFTLFARSLARSNATMRMRLVQVSRFALLGLVPLFGLRIVSLHQTDRVLYGGPLPLNWVIEGGICVTVLACAVLHARRNRSRARWRAPA